MLRDTIIRALGSGFVWKGAWADGTCYIVNDLVQNAGDVYICKLDHCADPTTEPGVGVNWQTYWDIFIDGTAGTSGTSGTSGSSGSSGSSGGSGTSGSSGSSGTSGTSGVSGTSGSSGTSGTSGVSGTSGSSGSSGTSGVSGTSGSSGTSGISPDIYIDSTSGDVYFYDDTRGKNLGVAIIQQDAGRNSTTVTNIYLAGEGNAPWNLNGFVLPWNCTLIAMSMSGNSNAQTWTAQIRSNGSVSVLDSLTITNQYTNYDDSKNIDFNAGDRVQIYCSGTSIDYPHVTLFFRRRF